MQIQINTAGMVTTDALDAHVREKVGSALGRFADRVTRVEAHLKDENAGKSGPADKRVVLEARPAGLDPIVVEERHEDFYAAVNQAADTLERALRRRFEKLDH